MFSCKLGFTLCKVEQPLRDTELKEKEEKDEKDIGKLLRKSSNKKGANNGKSRKRFIDVLICDVIDIAIS